MGRQRARIERDGMAELRPLEEDLPGPTRALAEALRTLFEQLGVSLTRYAVSASWDKSVVSRYLSGERIPPWNFIRDLLVQATRLRDDGAPPTRQVVEHLRDLHRAALEASDSPQHRVQLLEDKLADAAVEAESAAARERALDEALRSA